MDPHNRLDDDPEDEEDGQPFRPPMMVYITLDISHGFICDDSKMKAMGSSVQRLIQLSPPGTQFIIRTYYNHIQTILNETKWGGEGQQSDDDDPSMNVSELLGHPVTNVEDFTCLYDAFGETIRDIPKEDLKNERIFILMVLGSRDVGSTVDTLDSIIDLVNGVMRGDPENISLLFFQAGDHFKGLKTVEDKCWHRKLEIIREADTNRGIHTGFSKAEVVLRRHLTTPAPRDRRMTNHTSTPSGSIENLHMDHTGPRDEVGRENLRRRRRRRSTDSRRDSFQGRRRGGGGIGTLWKIAIVSSMASLLIGIVLYSAGGKFFADKDTIGGFGFTEQDVRNVLDIMMKDEKVFKCDHCNKYFSKREYYDDHLRDSPECMEKSGAAAEKHRQVMEKLDKIERLLKDQDKMDKLDALLAD